jgi:hypothetical protein
MASHSKLFTATAIMQLREAGKLRLDDPITKYLPGIASEYRRQAAGRIAAMHGHGLCEQEKTSAVDEVFAVIEQADFAFLFGQDTPITFGQIW